MKNLSLADQLKNLQQRKDLLVIFLLFFVIVIFWITIGLLTSQQRSGISSTQRQLAQPLSPNLDASVIDDLEQKNSYSPAELAEFPIFVVEENQPLVSTQSSEDGAVSQDQQIILPPELQGALDQLEDEL
jgi:hypothetical protein